jgi:microcystin-dependent protein
MSEPFIAEVRIFACDFAPRGWSFCDGNLLPISQNTALFSLISNTYGGDGRTTCALPNLIDRVPMHPGRGPGLTQRTLGESLGLDAVTLREDQMPEHNHNFVAVAQSGNSDQPSSDSYMSEESGNRKEQTYYISTSTTTNTNLSPIALRNMGGSGAHNNMQPFLGVNFCIALEGIYPSRS